MVVKWDAPEDGGSSIIKYKLAVKDAAYTFYPVDGTFTQLKYALPMDMLAKEPYFLKAGDLITVIVSAENDAGEGTVSLRNTDGAKMRAMPPRLNIPRVEGRTTASIIVGWDNVF